MKNNIKKILKENDDELPTLKCDLKCDLSCDDAFFDKLHDKIMNAIEEKVVESKIIPIKKKTRIWPFAIALSAVVLFFTFSIYKLIFYQNRHDDKIMRLGIESPHTLAEMTSYQNSSDFFQDVANQNFNNLDVKDLKNLISKN